jgi:hypothetical protein
LFQLLPLTDEPEDDLLLQIGKSYDVIIRTAITTLKRAPLQLVAPTIFILCILEESRQNHDGAVNLQGILRAIVNASVRRLNLAEFALDVVCFPHLVRVSDRFGSTLHSPNTMRCLEGRDAERIYVMIAAWMTSLFSAWTVACSAQGLEEAAESAAELCHLFASCLPQSKAEFGDIFCSEADNDHKRDRLYLGFREVTEL